MQSTKEDQYLLTLSTINVTNFVPTKLWFSDTKSNYQTWNEQMLCLLKSQKLVDLLLGGTRLPPKSTPDDPQTYNQEDVLWRTDQLVRGWILGSINDNIITFDLLKLKTSKDVWHELERKFRMLPSPVDASHQGAKLKQKDFNVYNVYLPLYKAILKEDWEEVNYAIKDHLQQGDSPILRARNDTIMTALQAAIGMGKGFHIIPKLVELIDDVELENLFDNYGTNILGMAAAAGNKEAAIIIVEKIATTLYKPNNFDDFPAHIAAQYSHKDTLEYLLEASDQHSFEPYCPANPYGVSTNGLRLFTYIIDAEFIGVALNLAVKHPNLAKLKLLDGTSALKKIAGKKSVFFSHRHFNLWQRFIYYCIPEEKELRPQFSMSSSRDIERMASDDVQRPKGVFQNLHAILWRYMERLVPQTRKFKEKLMVKQKAVDLVKYLCKEMESLSYPDAVAIYFDAVVTAAELEIDEAVDMIVEACPTVIYHSTPSGQYIFQMAVQNRSVAVFKLISQFQTVQKHLYSGVRDSDGNNLLHLAAKLSPSKKLNETSCAALQMQHELQWYQEVENFVHPHSREQLNEVGKSPEMVFTEEHKILKEEGEKWMKDTSNSCTIAASLIAAVMFAAAITVPGGNDSSSGLPIFSRNNVFIVFAIADAISLFTSATSLLMFLAILTSRFAEEDFLYVLPKRLIIGLGTLFLSITFMMLPFSATLYLVFGQKEAWVLIPVAALACLPVTSFVLLQFPLLVDLIFLTYGRGIFG